MAVLCGMSTIQYLARSAHSYIIYCLSLFRHVTVLIFAILVCRHFDHTPTSSGSDSQHYDMACRVTCEWASDVAENLGRFLVQCVQPRGSNDFELILVVKMERTGQG